MATNPDPEFIKGLQLALRKERTTKRTYQALAQRESNPARRHVLLELAETEAKHADRWSAKLEELGADIPPDRDSLAQRIWRWILGQSGTDNALMRLESAEVSTVE